MGMAAAGPYAQQFRGVSTLDLALLLDQRLLFHGAVFPDPRLLRPQELRQERRERIRAEETGPARMIPGVKRVI